MSEQADVCPLCGADWPKLQGMEDDMFPCGSGFGRKGKVHQSDICRIRCLTDENAKLQEEVLRYKLQVRTLEKVSDASVAALRRSHAEAVEAAVREIEEHQSESGENVHYGLKLALESIRKHLGPAAVAGETKGE